MFLRVVYLLIPTSNHNTLMMITFTSVLYIFWFLHQTTTLFGVCPPSFRCISFDSYIKPQRGICEVLADFRCISFDSYIKPQLHVHWCIWWVSCISFDSYIKPQPAQRHGICWGVVYLLIPTSNHNVSLSANNGEVLYIFYLSSG